MIEYLSYLVLGLGALNLFLRVATLQCKQMKLSF